MNNYNRSKNADNVLTEEILQQMIADASSEEVKAEDGYNPIKKCWNDQVKQRDVEVVVKAIGAINIDYLKR